MPTRNEPFSSPCVVVSLLSVAACTRTEGDPGFDMTDTPSADDSGAATDAGGGKGGAVGRWRGRRLFESTADHERLGRLRAGGHRKAGATRARARRTMPRPMARARAIRRLAGSSGMTAAHNAVRAMVMTQPALPPLTWSSTLAEYAQAWATQLAADPSTCAQPVHRSMIGPRGEGLWREPRRVLRPWRHR